MIGNSNCYYYVEELAGIAGAAGIDINLCNLYYPCCSLEKHWNFYANDLPEYKFYHTTKRERVELPIKTFTGALAFAKEKLGSDWDVISLQQTGYYTLIGDAQSALPHTLDLAKQLYSVIRESSQGAALYWHQPWAYEVGYGMKNEDPRTHVDSLEKQLAQHKAIKELAHIVSKQEGVQLVPTGDAWQLAAANELIGQTLCARKGINGDKGDCDHDGDIGGGQYLTACVWFEVLMKKSCIGNTWRPDYDLSEEKIAVLQEAAHNAVAEIYGSDHAK